MEIPFESLKSLRCDLNHASLRWEGDLAYIRWTNTILADGGCTRGVLEAFDEMCMEYSIYLSALSWIILESLTRSGSLITFSSCLFLCLCCVVLLYLILLFADENFPMFHAMNPEYHWTGQALNFQVTRNEKKCTWMKAKEKKHQESSRERGLELKTRIRCRGKGERRREHLSI